MPKFPESKLAHKHLDGLKGIEIGGSAHNSFAIPETINVDYTSEMTAHKLMEIELCGEHLPVDIVAEAWELPFKTSSVDFVLNSHVLEHLPDTMASIAEWHRVVRQDGIIFFVVPIRDMNIDDQPHPYTTTQHILDDFLVGETIDTHPCLPPFSTRGHYHHYCLSSFLQIIGELFKSDLEVIETLEKDDKVGNGFTVVCRVKKTRKMERLYRKLSPSEILHSLI